MKQKNEIKNGPFKPTWESLENYRIPTWYKDAKFGIFIHWGVYSVPAFWNEWYPRNMYLADHKVFKHHVKTYGLHSKFGYKDFIPMFKAEKFNPGQWAKLFRKSGAKFVVPVAEHHDGFAMYDCSLSRWNSVKMGPRRDIIGELAKEVRKHEMVFGVSSHRAEHWWFMGGGMTFDSDIRDPRYRDFYGPAKTEEDLPTPSYLEDWLARTCELVDKYKPQVLWFDWWIDRPVFAPYLKRLAAYYYNRAAQWKKGVAINYKNLAFPEETAVLDLERGQLKAIRPLLWQNDTSVSKNSWGHIAGQDYKTVRSILGDLVDVVSKNGVLLLNIGPKSDGTIPAPEQKLLLRIGAWLKVNGEAIYGTRPWKVFGEGPTEVAEGMFTDTKRGDFASKDIRFTMRGDHLYAIILNWPKDRKVVIKTLAEKSLQAPLKIRQVKMLGNKSALKWERNDKGLTVRLPSFKPAEGIFVLKMAIR